MIAVNKNHRQIQLDQEHLIKIAEAISEQRELAKEFDIKHNGFDILNPVKEYLKQVIKSELELDVEQVSLLIGKDEAYARILKLQEIIRTAPDDLILIYTDDLKVKDSFLEAIEERNSTYLSKDGVEIYKRLEDAVKLYNNLTPAERGCLKISQQKEMSINVMRIHNIRFY